MTIDQIVALANQGGAAAFSPLTLSPVIWFRADAGAGSSDADPVGTWTDQSGNGNSATQAVAAGKPTYKVNIRNGLPVVRADGSDSMATGAFTTVNQPLTIYIACKSFDVAAGKYISDGTGGRIAILSNPDNVWDIYAGGSDTNGGVADTNWHIFTLVANGASTTFQIDNGTPTTINPGTNALTGVRLFANIIDSGNGQVDIGEWLLFAGAHSAGNQTLMRTYLNSRWATF